jgi:hypothetical protein
MDIMKTGQRLRRESRSDFIVSNSNLTTQETRASSRSSRGFVGGLDPEEAARQENLQMLRVTDAWRPRAGKIAAPHTAFGAESVNNLSTASHVGAGYFCFVPIGMNVSLAWRF